MSNRLYKRATIGLCIACAGLVALNCYFVWSYAWLQVQVAFASEQTRVFEQMSVKAAANDEDVALASLEYVVSYYPSGTKQEKGSRLDLIVERERAFAVKEIIAHLRVKTGKDFGDSPEAWIQKYAKK